MHEEDGADPKDDLSQELEEPTSLAGFVRMVEFLRQEKRKREASRGPEYYIRARQIEKYEQQKDEAEFGEFKKGLQVKKAA